MSAPEFSRITSLADIGGVARHLAVSADESERAALAARFGLETLDRLFAEADIATTSDAIEASGVIRADYVQSCVASGAPIAQQLEEPFRIRFVAELHGGGEETELSEEDCDIMTHDGLAIDLGEAVAQTLGLAIDPFPRAPDADERLKAAGILQEEDASPFAKLKGLFDTP